MAITDASRLANFASNVGTGVTFAGNDILVAGVVTATSFVGDGSNITNAGSNLSAASGSQRVVVTSLTSGTMTSAGTDADLTWNSSTNTLSTGIVSATTLSGSITGTAATFTGNITGTTADFSGNVTIGGTLTYEDVANVDSVGIITAQSGIRVGSGESISAVSGTLTYYGDGSNLTGIEAGSANFVASGNISNGDTVVINTDGTVGIITTSGSLTPSYGNAVQYATGADYQGKCAYDTANNKVIIAYTDTGDSNYGKCAVGTVSGTSISFGSATKFDGNNASDEIDIAYDPSTGYVLLFYRDMNNNGNGRFRIGTVSSSTISFSSDDTPNSHNMLNLTLVSLGGGKVLAMYQDDDDSDKGKAVIVTINSATSMSFGSVYNFNTTSTARICGTYDSTNSQAVVAYTVGNLPKARVINISGTDALTQTEASILSSNVSSLDITFDTTNNVPVVAYNTGSKGSAKVGTISGNSISFGQENDFQSDDTSDLSITYDTDKSKLVCFYRTSASPSPGTNGRSRSGSISGNGITFDTEGTFNAADSSPLDSVYDPDSQQALLMFYSGSPSIAKIITAKTNSFSSNLSAENFIGIAAEAISNAATGKINIIGGINTGQVGLTTAKTHYVQDDGSLSTTPDNPSVVAGTAVSDTKILVWRS